MRVEIITTVVEEITVKVAVVVKTLRVATVAVTKKAVAVFLKKRESRL